MYSTPKFIGEKIEDNTSCKTRPFIVISVILPTFNAAHHLPSSITSILKQTEKNFELIIVDDGSTDNTKNLLEQWSRKDKRIRVFSFPKNLGIVAALNYGIQQAQFDYIARMDADDISHPQKLSKQLHALEQNKELGAISCLVAVQNTDSRVRGMNLYIQWTNSLVEPKHIYLQRFVESPIVHPTIMFRKNIIDQHGGYLDTRFPEDYELWLRWLHCHIKIAKIPEILFEWHDSPKRLTRLDSRYSVESFYECKTKYLAMWLIKKNIHHVVVWGAGRKSRKRAALLAKYQVSILGYIDVDPKKIQLSYNSVPVWSYLDVQSFSNHFILSYVANHGIRNKILQYLESIGKVNGTDFLIVA